MPLTKAKFMQLIKDRFEFIKYLKSEDDVRYRNAVIGVNMIKLKTIIELYRDHYKITKKERDLLDSIVKEGEDISDILNL